MFWNVADAGWRVAAWAPKAAVEQPLAEALWSLVVGGILLAGAVVLVVYWVSLQIGRSVHGLEDDARTSAEAASFTWTVEEAPTRVWDREETPPASASLVGNRWLWQGRELDPATGLYDFRHRWYSPSLGRFLTPDPLGYPDGPNPYAAFRGDPVNNSDPEGLAVPIVPVALGA